MPTYFRWFLLLSVLAGLAGLIIENTQPTVQAKSLRVAQHTETAFTPLQNIKQVAAGNDHTCALTTTGKVKCWGANYLGQLGDGTTDSKNTPVDVIGLNNEVVAITAGTDHTCALTNSGSVKCWGGNFWGQLGDGTTDSKNTPIDVIGLNNGAVVLTAGGDHTCAVTNTGKVKCWGSNFEGELGDGTRNNKTTPTDVNGLSNGVMALAAGRRHTCALTTSGGVMCWGGNDFGQLGDSTTGSKNTPTNVNDLDNGVVALTTGKYHTCAVTSTGSVKCWGQNIFGQLGDDSIINKSTPTDVSGLSSNVVTLAGGGWHTCAVTNTGGVKCWGANNTGQLGDNTATNKSTPNDVNGLSGIVALAAGGRHTCITTSTKGVKCWGFNGFGQLGNGITSDKSKPTDVSGLSNGIVALTAGWNHSCAVNNTGIIKCWGASGQLGDGATINKSVPNDVNGLSGVLAVVAGGVHTCVLTYDGGVKCWGENRFGQLGDGTLIKKSTPTDVNGLNSGVVALTAGFYHTCAVTNAGNVLCWGYNFSGQLGDGTTGNKNTPTNVRNLSSGVVALAAGESHTCALTNTGDIKCWGQNVSGQLGDETTNNKNIPTNVSGLSSKVVALAAGGWHTCAVTSTGSIKCWGLNDFGQLGDSTNDNKDTPTNVSGLASGMVALAVGERHTCAVTNTGELKCWGANGAGQLGNGMSNPGSFSNIPVNVSDLSSNAAVPVAGGNHTCTLTTTGGVKCWGSNREGQLGDGTAWSTTPVNVVVDGQGPTPTPSPTPSDTTLEPLIFIPGVAGSVLKRSDKPWPLWPNYLEPDEKVVTLLDLLWLGTINDFVKVTIAEMTGNADNLTLDTTHPSYRTDVIATDVIRWIGDKKTLSRDVYGSFLEVVLPKAGYKPYQLTIEMRPGFACDTSQASAQPTLFVFPYDWRQRIEDNAKLLDKYVACVQALHPNKKINIVAHSMGGLVARRYILDKVATSQPHHIDKFISMGSPWLGTPKLLYVLLTGKFDPIINTVMINESKMKTLIETFPGAHQLAPSPKYFDLALHDEYPDFDPPPFIEDGWDFNENGINHEIYSFGLLQEELNVRYPAKPLKNNQEFHTVVGQDDWRDDASGIKYFHIIGNVGGFNSKDLSTLLNSTISQVKASAVCLLNGSACVYKRYVAVDWSLGGDDTVVDLSLFGNQGLNDTESTQQTFMSFDSAPQFDGGFDDVRHASLPANERVQKYIENILQGNVCQSDLNQPLSSASTTTETLQSYTIKVIGTGTVLVQDSIVQLTGRIGDLAIVENIPGIGFYSSSDDALTLLMPVSQTYTITLESRDSPLFVELTRQNGNLTTYAVRYPDLTVPATTTLQILLSAQGIESFTYDSDGDSIADTPIAQSPLIITGTQAADTVPPTVTIQTAAINQLLQITITTKDDGAGVQTTYYSLDGIQFQPYTSTLTINAGQATAIYAFADDKVANRSSLIIYALLTANQHVYLPVIQR